MELKPGDFVRHTSKPNWGVGRVVAVDGGKASIEFADQLRVLRLDVAGQHLEMASKEEAERVNSQLKPANPPRIRPHQGPDACAACNRKLNQSRFSTDGTWKACPKCSSRHGHLHVYRRCPSDFGKTPERVTDDNPEGLQSYCDGCRFGGSPALQGPHVVTCDGLTTVDKWRETSAA